MAKQRTDWECARTRELCRELTELGALCKVEQAGTLSERSYQAAGWPDRYVCHRLWHGWLEFKGSGVHVASGLTVKQKATLEALWARQPGGCFVVRHEDVGCTVWSHDGKTRLATCANPGQLLLALYRLHRRQQSDLAPNISCGPLENRFGAPLMET